MSTRVLRNCRDCGQEVSETPDDPAPALCPPCYEKRLARCMDEFVLRAEMADNPVELASWLARALHEIAGETPAFAKKHASDLLFQALFDRA